MGNSLNKKGFGIMEILVSIVVLGFLMMALLNLQLGNREVFLRIRARDGAVNVAQNAIDSLSLMGAAALSKHAIDSQVIEFEKSRSWPRTVGFPMEVVYSVRIEISDDSTETSAYQSLNHTYAKRLDVTVSWPYKTSVQSIKYSGVVR